jgi:hypothetical protein
MNPDPSKRKRTGFAIALAWPETYCKQPGAWYDPLMRLLGINRGYYYRVGHAAVVLVDSRNGACHYFDLGRYHAPTAHARVRSAKTDHDLAMYTRAQLSVDRSRINNVSEILYELQQNESCHGAGTLHASYTLIDFDAALKKAIAMQEASPLPYGPFVIGGSNCSRFVKTVVLAGKPGIVKTIRLTAMMPITPTPMSNVEALGDATQRKKRINGSKIVSPMLDQSYVKTTLPPPPKPAKVPETARWLSGEGAGSWFEIVFRDGKVHMNRYAPDGTIECKGLFKNNDLSLMLKDHHDPDYEIIHPSHCQQVTIRVSGRKIVLKSLSVDSLIR